MGGGGGEFEESVFYTIVSRTEATGVEQGMAILIIHRNCVVGGC